MTVSKAAASEGPKDVALWGAGAPNKSTRLARRRVGKTAGSPLRTSDPLRTPREKARPEGRLGRAGGRGFFSILPGPCR